MITTYTHSSYLYKATHTVMYVWGNDIFVFSSFSNQPSGPFRFRGDNQFVGISESQESLIRFVEAQNENES